MFLVGLDLGQANDFSALSVVERTDRPADPVFGYRPPVYAVRHMQRWPLGTPYTQIVGEVAFLMDRPPLPGAHLVIDATGVGRAVVDMFRLALGSESRSTKNSAIIVPITIKASTAFQTVADGKGGWNVPKRDIGGVLHVLMSTRRLSIAPLPMKDKLLQEMRTFTIKVSKETGNESFEAFREVDHDDMVICLALPLWFGENGLRSATLYVHKHKKDKQKKICCIVCNAKELAELRIGEEHICCIVDMRDDVASLSPHGLVKLAGVMKLSIPDKAPEECQKEWQQWADKVMGREHGRILWRFLLRNQAVETQPNVLIFVDNGGADRRAVSVARGVVDSMRLDPTSVRGFDGEPVEERQENKHVRETVKLSRLLVMR